MVLVMAEQHKPVRVSVWERPQQYRIDDAEDRRIRADTQAESERGDTGKAGVSPQRPHTKPQILKECIDESDSTHIAMRLLQQCQVSELAPGGPGGLLFGHPLADISPGEQAQVRLDLVVEL